MSDYQFVSSGDYLTCNCGSQDFVRPLTVTGDGETQETTLVWFCLKCHTKWKLTYAVTDEPGLYRWEVYE